MAPSLRASKTRQLHHRRVLYGRVSKEIGSANPAGIAHRRRTTSIFLHARPRASSTRESRVPTRRSSPYRRTIPTPSSTVNPDSCSGRTVPQTPRAAHKAFILSSQMSQPGLGTNTGFALPFLSLPIPRPPLFPFPEGFPIASRRGIDSASVTTANRVPLFSFRTVQAKVAHSLHLSRAGPPSGQNGIPAALIKSPYLGASMVWPVLVR